MKRTTFALIFFTIIACVFPKSSKAQTIELLAGNTLNGAVTGTILGGATMALENTTEFDALRVGVGLGILGGIGVGVYDITYGKGNEMLVSGLFNDGNNSTIIILLDTFYGAAAGGVIATSVMMVANEPLVDGLQYGAGIGAFAGFGFGLVDSFVLAQRSHAGSYSANMKSPSSSASGLMSINFDESKSLGLVNPSLIKTYDFSSSTITQHIQPTIEMVNFRVNF